MTELESLDSTFSNIWFISEDTEEGMYPISVDADFLITDYSNIYLDYLLLKDLSFFTPFDIESYTEFDLALYYDYQDVTPGPKRTAGKKSSFVYRRDFPVQKKSRGEGRPVRTRKTENKPLVHHVL